MLPSNPSNENAKIDMYHIAAGLRGKGWGSKCMAVVLAVVSNEIPGVMIEVSSPTPEGMKFYPRVGFENSHLSLQYTGAGRTGGTGGTAKEAGGGKGGGASEEADSDGNGSMGDDEDSDGEEDGDEAAPLMSLRLAHILPHCCTPFKIYKARVLVQSTNEPTNQPTSYLSSFRLVLSFRAAGTIKFGRHWGSSD